MHDPPSTHMSLIRRLGNPDDSRAWSTFVDQYTPSLVRYAKRKGLQDADAYDLVQEVLGAISKHVDRFEPRLESRSFRRWFYRIAHTKLCDLVEKRLRQPKPVGDVPESLRVGNLPPEEGSSWLEQERRRELFHRAAEEIRPQFQENTWKAFWASAVEGVGAQTVAQRLNMSVGAVYIAKSRVMAKLKDRIRDWESQGLSFD